MHQAPGSQDDFEEWELRLIRREAEAFAGARRLRWSDVDDLENGAQLAWWHQRSNYNPERGASKRTYLKRVVRNAMSDLAKSELTQGRSAEREARLLSELSGKGAIPLYAKLADQADALGVSRLAHDLRIAAAQLTPRQRAVLRGLLVGYAMTELAQELGVHRDTLYQDRRRIQEVFRKSGLGRSDS